MNSIIPDRHRIYTSLINFKISGPQQPTYSEFSYFINIYYNKLIQLQWTRSFQIQII